MSTHLCEVLYTDFHDMLVLSLTVALHCYNCRTDGSIKPGNYGYHFVDLHIKKFCPFISKSL
jgi:hypothetical protein